METRTEFSVRYPASADPDAGEEVYGPVDLKEALSLESFVNNFLARESSPRRALLMKRTVMTGNWEPTTDEDRHGQ